MSDVVVVGAGITGLTLAHRLAKLGRSVTVLEASERAGGVMRTIESDGFLVEAGPNSLLTTPESDALCRELGIAGDIVAGDPRAPRYIVRRGRPVAIKPGPGALFAPILSWSGRLRLLGDLFLGAPEQIEDESVDAFVTRRFGADVARYLAGPFVSGVYAGDPARLSMRSAFPKVWQVERRHRKGVIRGMFKGSGDKPAAPPPAGPKPARYRRRTASFRTGLQALPSALGSALGPALRLSCEVARIEPRPGGGYAVELASGERLEAPQLALAVPPRATARLLQPFLPDAAAAAGAIESARVASVSLGYPVDAFASPPDGFGVLVPRCEDIRLLGCLFMSSLFPGRAPEGFVATTSFIGGMLDPTAIELSDGELAQAVHADVRRLLGVKAEPKVIAVSRHAEAIPQYNIGHHTRIAALEAALAPHPALAVVGNWRGGVAIADCIASGEAAAKSISYGLPASTPQALS